MTYHFPKKAVWYESSAFLTASAMVNVDVGNGKVKENSHAGTFAPWFALYIHSLSPALPVNTDALFDDHMSEFVN